MSWMDDGGFEMQTLTAQDGRPMARMIFRTSTGPTCFILTKTDVQRVLRECGANPQGNGGNQMTDHDYRLEDQRDHKPNYTLRRVKTALASIAFVVSCTLLFVAERPASAPGLWIVAGIYLTTGLWLILRFAPREDEPDSSTRPVGRHGESRDN